MPFLSLRKDGIRELPREIVQLAKDAVRKIAAYRGDERRAEAREAMAVLVLAVEVDQENRPLSKPFHAVTRDLSQHGICLFHDAPLSGRRIVVDVPKGAVAPAQLIVDVLRTRPFGPGYETGGRIVDRLHPPLVPE